MGRLLYNLWAAFLLGRSLRSLLQQVAWDARLEGIAYARRYAWLERPSPVREVAK